jgi:hypothetical protein
MQDYIGKRIFFINPPALIRDELVDLILSKEYEVYFIQEPADGKTIIKNFPGSIVFIYIDNILSPRQWEDYVIDWKKNTLLNKSKIGIISYNTDPTLEKRYLMQIGIECGFVHLKLGLSESSRIILKVLEANDARGRRKYVRAQCEEISQVSLNVKILNRYEEGKILDISSVGLAVRFSQGIVIKPKSLIRDIQLKLKTFLVNIDAVVIGNRSDDSKIYVLLFKHGEQTKAKIQIRRFIHQQLQENISQYLKSASKK